MPDGTKAGGSAGATTGVDVEATRGVDVGATSGEIAGASAGATPGAHVGARTEAHAGAIRFEGVTVRYPGESAPAVDNVTLDIEPGTLAVVLGPSGCGKTTLLKSVNRLVEPTHGRVLIDDKDTAQLEPTALRRRIGYVIQATGLFPHMSVARNIGVVPRLLGWSSVRIAERVDEMLALVNLPPDYGPRAPTQLSGGEAQRVGIARALAADPAFLLMDEPFGSLDAINRLRLQDELCAINRRLVRTILFVTHDVDEALRIADRIVVMREGRVIQAAPPLDLLLSPADDFVAELLDADDLFRRLGLMSVGDALALEGVGGVGGGGEAGGSTAGGVGGGDKMGSDGGRPGRVGEGAEAGRLSAAEGVAELETVSSEDDLREALSALLRSGGDGLAVVGPGGERVGTLTLAALRAAARARR